LGDVQKKVCQQLYFCFGLLVRGKAMGIAKRIGDANGLELWRKLHEEYEPVEGNKMLADFTGLMDYTFGNDLRTVQEHLLFWETEVEEYESHVREKVQENFKMGVILKGMPDIIREHLTLNLDTLDTYQKQRAMIVKFLKAKRAWSTSLTKKDAWKNKSQQKEEDAMDVSEVYKGWGKGKGKGKKGKGKESLFQPQGWQPSKGAWAFQGWKGGKKGKGKGKDKGYKGKGKGKKGKGKDGKGGQPWWMAWKTEWQDPGNSWIKSKFQGTCNKCGKYGHKARDCRSNPSGPGPMDVGAVDDDKGDPATGAGKGGKAKTVEAVLDDEWVFEIFDISEYEEDEFYDMDAENVPVPSDDEDEGEWELKLARDVPIDSDSDLEITPRQEEKLIHEFLTPLHGSDWDKTTILQISPTRSIPEFYDMSEMDSEDLDDGGTKEEEIVNILDVFEKRIEFWKKEGHEVPVSDGSFEDSDIEEGTENSDEWIMAVDQDEVDASWEMPLLVKGYLEQIYRRARNRLGEEVQCPECEGGTPDRRWHCKECAPSKVSWAHDAEEHELNYDLEENRVTVRMVMEKEDRVCLTLDARMTWTWPGGKKSPTETMEQAMRREMREETGIDILEEHLVLKKVKTMTRCGKDWKIAYFTPDIGEHVPDEFPGARVGDSVVYAAWVKKDSIYYLPVVDDVEEWIRRMNVEKLQRKREPQVCATMFPQKVIEAVSKTLGENWAISDWIERADKVRPQTKRWNLGWRAWIITTNKMMQEHMKKKWMPT
jgi:8-oxo-dGTP pyrophosphatase MutT (NUDIX family)